MRLFLNLDGVLHPNRVRYQDGRRPRLELRNHKAMEHASHLEKALEPYDDVRVVLTTWWTYYLGPDACKAMLPSTLARRVDGAILNHSTFYDAFPHRLNGTEARLVAEVDDYLVLDHLHSHYSATFLPKLLLIDESMGLGDEIARSTLSRRLELAAKTSSPTSRR